MTQRTVWWCSRCNIAPDPQNLIAPEPPMHDHCESTCTRRTFDDSDTGGPAVAPPGVDAKEQLRAACEPPRKPEPPRMG